jgi:hypothetical protein
LWRPDEGHRWIEPPQGEVIEKILRHCGLWHGSAPQPPTAHNGFVDDPDGSPDNQPASFDEPRELTYVDSETFPAAFSSVTLSPVRGSQVSYL